MYLDGSLYSHRCDNNNQCPYMDIERTSRKKTGNTDFNSNRHGRVKKTAKLMAVDMIPVGGGEIKGRNEEVLALRNKFPTKVPIIIKRFPKEMYLPHLDKSKYLVPQEITMSQFQTIIRNRMRMGPNQSLYLLVNNRSMLSMSRTLAEAYNDYAGPDGFLYVTYASQEVFGC